MIPRKKLDIGPGDLIWSVGRAALAAAEVRVLPARAARVRRALQARVEHRWDPAGRAVATLSIRSGFDRLLSVLGLPRGSEVLCSAVTIPDMATIAQAHGLAMVPVDMDMDTLSLTTEALNRAWSPRARVLLLAHLFGSRMSLDETLRWARRRELLVLEDAAQAYTGDGYRGHDDADVSMFSFGPIKTATCLGGGILRFRDEGLAERVRTAQRSLPVQPETRLLARALRYCALGALLCRPAYTAFVALCRARGHSHDAIINGAVRGFAGDVLLAAIRHQPSSALLALMLRRLDPRRVERTHRTVLARSVAARELLARLPHLPHPGSRAAFHSHWVVPVQVMDPPVTAELLRRAGIDATCGASSLSALPLPATHDLDREPPATATRVMAQVLYIPGDPGITRHLGRELRALTPPPVPLRRPVSVEAGA